MEQVEFQGRTINFERFGSLAEFKALDGAVAKKLNQLAMNGEPFESHPLFMRMEGVVIHGDVHLEPDEKDNVLNVLAVLLGCEYGSWLIFRDNVTVSLGIAVPESTRVAVLGDLTAVGVCNVQEILLVGGKTSLSGGLMFDSDNGGFTSLDLAEPVGIVATTSNFFNVNLKAKYYFDPIFRCGFHADPSSPHEEIILDKFETMEGVSPVPLEAVADFFATLNEEVGQEVRDGQWRSWMEYYLTMRDSRDLVRFLDARS